MKHKGYFTTPPTATSTLPRLLLLKKQPRALRPSSYFKAQVAKEATCCWRSSEEHTKDTKHEFMSSKRMTGKGLVWWRWWGRKQNRHDNKDKTCPPPTTTKKAPHTGHSSREQSRMPLMSQPNELSLWLGPWAGTYTKTQRANGLEYNWKDDWIKRSGLERLCGEEGGRDLKQKWHCNCLWLVWILGWMKKMGKLSLDKSLATYVDNLHPFLD